VLHLYCQPQTQLSKDVTASIRISVRYFTYGEINRTPPLVHPTSPLRVPAQRLERGTGWHCYRFTGRKRLLEFSGPSVRLRQPTPAIPPERRADSLYPADSDEAG
jgi:hypothetical protein